MNGGKYATQKNKELTGDIVVELKYVLRFSKSFTCDPQFVSDQPKPRDRLVGVHASACLPSVIKHPGFN